MIKTIINKFNNMDEKVKKILKYGINFSIFVCIVSTIVLITYHINLNIDLYYIGLAIFRLGLFLLVEFIICAFAIDTIKKQANT